MIYSYFALANETGKQEEETATKKNLLKHEFSRTATITGLDAHILAEEVRKRRGTVYMHTDQVNEIFRLEKDVPHTLDHVFSHSTHFAEQARNPFLPSVVNLEKLTPRDQTDFCDDSNWAKGFFG